MSAPVAPTGTNVVEYQRRSSRKQRSVDLHCSIARVVVTKGAGNRRVITGYDNDFPE
jgi:hypothetical protein